MTTPTRSPSLWANLPNWLTAARFVMAAALFVLMAFQLWSVSIVLFVLAAITDWLDGYLARKYKWTSDLGRNLDPLADKVLVCGAFIFLLQPGKPGELLIPTLHPWVVCVVVLRELGVTALRTYMEGQGVKFGADWLGKLKMWLQSAAIVACFLTLLVTDSESWGWLVVLRDGAIYVMATVTVFSGLQYLAKAIQIMAKPGGNK
jgi:CDP-diacylglycerol--glycerol-3-phosphate 3-phosphatidyltransferase